MAAKSCPVSFASPKLEKNISVIICSCIVPRQQRIKYMVLNTVRVKVQEPFGAACSQVVHRMTNKRLHTNPASKN